MANRFVIDLQSGTTPEETNQILMQQLIRLTEQINAAKLPIVVGPNDKYPEGIETGQTIIDYSSGTTVLKTFDGTQLV